ncbi:MAG: amino acid decarboxylase [Faecalibacterium sp.]
MQTPIFDFVQQYQQSGNVRFHMPGHKGRSVLGCEGLDITEIAGADNLQHPEAGGIITQSEQNATELFGTAHTYYSAGGSSACISAMLYLAKLCAPAPRKGRILAGRNAHKVFIQSCALLDMQPTWLYPSSEQAQGLCACPISPTALAQQLAAQQAVDMLPMAVYITSPDYLGNLADIAGLSAVCAQYALPLLVDNAHGAYLKFLQPSQHPIDQGAAMCADSAHKTLPVLTGGAYLHIANGVKNSLPQADSAAIDEGMQSLYCAHAKAALSLFSSTSPSYLILQSLDVCNAYLAGEYPAELADCVQRVAMLKDTLRSHGDVVCDSEPLKIVMDCRIAEKRVAFAPQRAADELEEQASDIKIANKHAAAIVDVVNGEALAEYLRGQGIEVEFADPDFLVCMCTPQNTAQDFARLAAALCAREIPQCLEKGQIPFAATIGEDKTNARTTTCTLREAMFSTGEEILVENAVGRTCRMANVACPPAIPIVVSGEVITKQDVNLFRYYGIETVNVIKEG